MNYHLSLKENEWRLEKEGSNRALLAAATKGEALEKTAEYMDGKDGAVYIHKKNGQFEKAQRFGAGEGEASSRKTVGPLTPKTWSILGIVAIAAATAVGVVYYYRNSIPLDRLRLDRMRLPRF